MQPLRGVPVRSFLHRFVGDPACPHRKLGLAVPLRHTAALCVLAAGLGVAAPAQAGEPAKEHSAAAEATATAVLNRLVDDLWERSDHYFHSGDYETTTRVTRLVVRLDPEFVDALTTGAWVLRAGLNRPEDAAALLHRCVRDNPDRYEGYFDLGMLYFDRKEYALAAHYFAAATKRGAPATRQHMLPHTYEKMGRRAEALNAWRAILQRFPDDEVGRRNLERLEKNE